MSTARLRMPPPADVHLGPRTRLLIDRSAWSASSVFPSGQEWADDTERILGFLEAQGVLETFLPRLLAREWEGAFAEARVGYFFKRNGFKVLNWEPMKVPDRPGDIDIQWMETEPIFVEVKGPGWKGELAPGFVTIESYCRNTSMPRPESWTRFVRSSRLSIRPSPSSRPRELTSSQ